MKRITKRMARLRARARRVNDNYWAIDELIKSIEALPSRKYHQAWLNIFQREDLDDAIEIEISRSEFHAIRRWLLRRRQREIRRLGL